MAKIMRIYSKSPLNAVIHFKENLFYADSSKLHWIDFHTREFCITATLPNEKVKIKLFYEKNMFLHSSRVITIIDSYAV